MDGANIHGFTETMEKFNPQPPTLDTNSVQLPSGGMEELQQMVTQGVVPAFQKLGDYIADAQQGFQAYKDISNQAARLYLGHDANGAAAVTASVEHDSPVLRSPAQHVPVFGGK
jgi:hypothetical protein